LLIGGEEKSCDWADM
jgi:hypothetical protein